MAPRGRPRKKVTDRRGETCSFVATRAEQKAIAKAARHANLSKSVWMRTRLLSQAAKEAV